MAGLTGFSGEVRCDASKPNGLPRRQLATTRAARPLRFALTGGLAGLLQLGLLALLMGRGWPAAPANAVAFLLAAQVNFALSSVFTWRDRRRTAPPVATVAGLPRR